MALYLKINLEGDKWNEKERTALYQILITGRIIKLKLDDAAEHARLDEEQNVRSMSVVVCHNNEIPEAMVLGAVNAAQAICNAEFTYTFGTYPVGKRFRKWVSKNDEHVEGELKQQAKKALDIHNSVFDDPSIGDWTNWYKRVDERLNEILGGEDGKERAKNTELNERDEPRK